MLSTPKTLKEMLSKTFKWMHFELTPNIECFFIPENEWVDPKSVYQLKLMYQWVDPQGKKNFSPAEFLYITGESIEEVAQKFWFCARNQFYTDPCNIESVKLMQYGRMEDVTGWVKTLRNCEGFGFSREEMYALFGQMVTQENTVTPSSGVLARHPEAASGEAVVTLPVSVSRLRQATRPETPVVENASMPNTSVSNPTP